ncbi:FUSC family protein [Endozoicomonas atrinae]|uniref:FUSC family protein n=1 Tax=Endozoicomonas atrinae TaxID=1333660 RepID=UPI00082682ED|nr:FUSC family protein [Endozoicomonas atrinae]
MERMAIRSTLRYSCIAFIAYISGYVFSWLSYEPTAMIGGLWAVISGLIVSEPATVQESISTAKTRIIGSAIGSVLAAIYLLFFTFNAITYAIFIGAASLLCYRINCGQHVKLAAITISVVIIVSTVSDINPVLNATLRLFESCIGVGTGVLVSYLLDKCFRTGKGQR